MSSRVALTPRLAKWKSDIEATGKTTVVLARVYTDTARNELQLGDDAEFRPSLEKLLSHRAFTTLFIQTFAMNVNLNTGIRPISVVLLNMARSTDWKGEEDAVIAHEFGHIWLHVNGYPALDAVSRLPARLSMRAISFSTSSFAMICARGKSTIFRSGCARSKRHLRAWISSPPASIDATTLRCLRFGWMSPWGFLQRIGRGGKHFLPLSRRVPPRSNARRLRSREFYAIGIFETEVCIRGCYVQCLRALMALKTEATYEECRRQTCAAGPISLLPITLLLRIVGYECGSPP